MFLLLKLTFTSDTLRVVPLKLIRQLTRSLMMMGHVITRGGITRNVGVVNVSSSICFIIFPFQRLDD